MTEACTLGGHGWYTKERTVVAGIRRTCGPLHKAVCEQKHPTWVPEEVNMPAGFPTRALFFQRRPVASKNADTWLAARPNLPAAGARQAAGGSDQVGKNSGWWGGKRPPSAEGWGACRSAERPGEPSWVGPPFGHSGHCHPPLRPGPPTPTAVSVGPHWWGCRRRSRQTQAVSAGQQRLGAAQTPLGPQQHQGHFQWCLVGVRRG